VKETSVRINLWSSPRNVSTAFMYSFAQRKDTTVVDEPLYAYYLQNVAVNHPAKSEILDTMEHDLPKLISDVLLKNYGTPIVFFKQMTHHLWERNYDFLAGFKNIIFIRDPRLIIRSYTKVRQQVTMQDIGIQQQVELLNRLENPIVLDSETLLENPKTCLQALCKFLNISFDAAMLKWEAGARKEDGVWAKHWYHNVHQSTEFQSYKKENFVMKDNLEELAEACLPYYQLLLKKRLIHTH